MAGLSEQVFRRAPRPLKDVLCSVYGLRLHRKRYGGRHAVYRAEAQAEERLSARQLEHLSLSRLRETLVRAGRDVPYYREMFRELVLDPETVELPGGLARIPPLDKATVRAAPQRFVSEAVRGLPLEVRETSGTTGSPLSVVADLDSLRRHYAIYDRFRAWAGSSLGRRRATFNGRVLWPAARDRAPFWVRDWTERNTLFSVYHLGPRVLPYYVEALRRCAPEEIHAYPSALATLARFARASGLELPRPRAIITSAETLARADRELFTEAFGCPVFDQYGNAEMTLFAGDCERGRMHLDTGYSWVELLAGETDDDGTLRGDALTTGYVNRAMPLIRYRVGDTIAMDPRPCACGRPQPLLREVVGRTDDQLILPDGRIVGRLDPVFKGLTGLDQVQIVQETRQRVVARVVPGRGFDPAAERELLRALAERLGPSVDIGVQIVPSIERSARGKFQAVIRAFDAEPPR